MPIITTNQSDIRRLVGDIDAVVEVPVNIAPTLSGAKGKAWAIDVPTLLRKHNIDPKNDGCLGSWVIEAPWAHPAWHSYNLVLVHLREMPDKRPTKFYLPLATHEFWLYALDQDAPRSDIIIGSINAAQYWLSPSQFAAQMVEVSDDLAIGRMHGAILEICDGKLSPDVDFQKDWIARFGNNMIKKEYR